MELRHLRYFVAVAEEGSLTLAAERRLHTAQPSLSRQIRDLEYEVGTELMTRGVRGIELTAAGRAFLDHARLALAQADAAIEAARQAARPAKQGFALGFLTGQEMDWLPGAMNLLRGELADIEVTVSSDSSPELAEALVRGRIDLAFMRAEAGRPELAYRVVATEPIVLVLPSDHRLASRKAIAIEELAGETFIGMSKTAPVFAAIVEDYLERKGVAFRREHAIDNLGMAMSLVASTRGLTLLPAYAENFLTWSVISRPLLGDVPTIDLVIAYNRANTSPVLKRFLSRSDELVGLAARDARSAGRRA
jgi:LysR family transcriptional regulator, hca operon transcriptional activator